LYLTLALNVIMMMYTLVNGVAILTSQSMLLSMGLTSLYIYISLIIIMITFCMESFLSIMIMYEIRECTQTYNINNHDIIL